MLCYSCAIKQVIISGIVEVISSPLPLSPIKVFLPAAFIDVVRLGGRVNPSKTTNSLY